MLESMYDLMQRKQKQVMVDFDRKRVEDRERKREGEGEVFKKPRPVGRLSKNDISSPCNFKHVSGECGCARVEWCGCVRGDSVIGVGVGGDFGAGYCRDHDAAVGEL